MSFRLYRLPLGLPLSFRLYRLPLGLLLLLFPIHLPWVRPSIPTLPP